MNTTEQPCPCGSGVPLAKCCGPLIAGLSPAASAEGLMRSRYTAFVLGDSAYLLASWHPSTRPAELDLGGDDTDWQGLTILNSEAGMPGDAKGVVEFAARYCRQGREWVLHERSRFLFETGKWFYLDGDIQPDKPPRTGRNVPCTCGSGRKFKRCCGAS